MSDVTDICDRIARLTRAASQQRDTWSDTWSELCQIDSDLRAARDAADERVRSVVREIADQHLDCVLDSVVVDAIASRVAEQLAGSGVGLSAEEREILTGLRRSSEGQLASIGHLGCGIPEKLNATIALLDRLLASPPATEDRVGVPRDQHCSKVGGGCQMHPRGCPSSRRATDLHTALNALLDSDMPAGELRKALAELVGRR